MGNKTSYSEEFKKQIVMLYKNGKSVINLGPNKTAELVQQSFHKITRPLNQITLFHNDRGNEFKNKIIDEILITFNIKRSLRQ